MKRGGNRFILINLVMIFVLLPVAVSGKTLVGLKIKPENVGVFYQNKTQQFQAIGVFSDGSEENYTKKVGWSIEANPLLDQTLSPQQVAKINENGLATVNNTWGRINVVATYPKPITHKLTGIIDLLLKKPG